MAKGKHLTLRSLAGPFRKGITLYPIDATDPPAFQALHEGQLHSVVFKRNAGGQVDRLCIGFDALFKRPRTQSLRFRATTALGGLAGLIVAGLHWRKLRKQ